MGERLDGMADGGKKLLAVVLFIYMLSPIDLLPEIVLGPIGLIDDAIAFVIFWLTIKSIWKSDSGDAALSSVRGGR